MVENPNSNSIPLSSADAKQAREEFFQGCMLGNIEKVQAMLMYSFNVNLTDALGNTPIMKAAQYGHLEIVKLLLAHGAKVTARNSAGWTALDFAINYSHPEIEQYLRIHGARE